MSTQVQQTFDHYGSSAQAAATKAVKDGLVVDWPDDNQLHVDIDNEADFQRMIPSIIFLQGLVEADTDAVATVSRHGNWHVRLALPFDVSPLERIALQACLSSDPRHELLSFFALKAGDETPSVLFENPDYQDNVRELGTNKKTLPESEPGEFFCDLDTEVAF